MERAKRRVWRAANRSGSDRGSARSARRLALVCPWRLSDSQHDLPARVARLAQLVRALDLVERQHLAQLEAHLAGRHLLADPGELLRVRARHVHYAARAALAGGLLGRCTAEREAHTTLAQGT